MKNFLLVLFICAAGMKVNAQIIDSTFGIPTSLDPCCLVYGVTGCNFGGFDQAFLAVHLDDGRIILAGDTRWQGVSDFAMVRLMPDGQYDQTAGPDGQVRIDLGYPNDSCLTATRYQNDRILMGGCVWPTGANGYVNLMARIDFDGNLDPSFGNGGYLTLDLPVEHEMITKILPQPDGKILVGGNAFYGVSVNFPDSVDVFIGRLFPNGQVDSTFGENGFVYHRWYQICNSALLGDISTDAQGRVVATGGSYDPYPNNYEGDEWCSHNIFICRYLSDGQLDQGFGINGSLELPYTKNGRGNTLLHYEDGRILLAGASGDGLIPFPAYVFITRFMPDGTLDLSFGENGRFRKFIIVGGPISGGAIEPFGLLRIRNRILVMNLFEINSDPHNGFSILCLKESGKIDSTFGVKGSFNVSPDLLIPAAFINQMSSSSDENLFFSGYTRLLQHNNMAIFKVRWDETSKTQEQSALNEVKIYPNPVTDGLFHVDLGNLDGVAGPLLLKIRDINGRILYEQDNIVGSISIKTTDFSTGIYLVELVGPRSRYMGKIVVQHK